MSENGPADAGLPTVGDVCGYLRQIAPLDLAETWDNVGLLVGDPARTVARAMTCLTVTDTTAAEAVELGVDLVVTHHPCPFHGLKRITSEAPTGRILLRLIEAKVAVYSGHTAYDSAVEGINQQIAVGLGLRDVRPLVGDAEGRATGRLGCLAAPVSLHELALRAKVFFQVATLQRVGDPGAIVRRVAVACGAAGELVEEAIRAKCDAMVLGETRLHTCLEAESQGLGLLMPGHFASERFAMEQLADSLRREYADIEVWASRRERDPIQYVSY